MRVKPTIESIYGNANDLTKRTRMATAEEETNMKLSVSRVRLRPVVLGLLLLCSSVAHAVTYSHAPTTFNWIDPSSQTPVVWSNPTQGTGGICDTIGDDSITAPINIGFTFNFGGVAYTQLRIMSNGRLQFNNTYCYAGTQNVGPPRTYTLPYPNANLVTTMKVYGADIDTSPNGSGGGPGPTTCPPATCSVRYTVTPLGVVPNRQFVVTWTNTPDWGSTGSYYNFQVILNENGTFIYQYGPSNNPDGGHADIGWEVDTSDYDLYTYTSIGALANTAILFYIPNTVAEYRMEEPSWSGANSVLDSSGNNHNGTPVGGAQTVAGGYICRGANIPSDTSLATVDAINTGLNVPLQIGSSGTITFWYKDNSAWSGASQQLLDATQVNNRWFFLVKRANSRLRFVVTDSAGNTTIAETGNQGFSAGRWVHIGITWNLTNVAANNRLRIYVNGALSTSQAISGANPLNASIGNLFVGDNGNTVVGQQGTGNSADGVIDEVRIYGFEGGDGLILRDYNNSRSCTLPVDHYELSLPTSSITCMPSAVKVTACADASSPCTNPSPTVSGETATLATTGGTLALNPLTFDATGAASTTLSYPSAPNATAVTVTLSGTQSPPVNPSTCCPDGANCVVSSSCSTTFNTAGFIISNAPGGAGVSIPAQVAGTSDGNTYYLRAVKTSTTTQACEAALQGAQSVNLAYECNNPTTCYGSDLMSVNGGAATTIARNNSGSVTSYTPVSLTFDANGNAPFTFLYNDVGQVTLHALDTVNSATLTGASNAFVVKPYAFGVTSSGANNIQCTNPSDCAPYNPLNPNNPPYNPGASNASGPAFMKAGAPFSVTVIATSFTGATTPSYGQESPPQGVTLTANLVAPAGGNNPGLSNPSAFGAFSNGAATGTTFSWGEVGIITLTPSVAGGSYLGAGNVTGVTSGNVGRFVPAYFDVTYSHGCASTAPFTYSGEPFPAPLGVTATAYNVAGTQTRNYDGGSGFSKDTTISDALGGTSGTFPSPGNVIGAASFANGQGWSTAVTYTFSTEDTPKTQVGLRATDLDQVSSSGHLEPTEWIYSGRIDIQNAYGSELLPLAVPMRAEYYDASGGWIINTADTCTSVPATSLSLANNILPSPVTPPAGKKVGIQTTYASVANSPLAGGDAGLSLSAPGAGGEGYVDITADLSAMPWLRYIWTGGAQVDPTGKATFGIYKGSPRHIYLRELY